MKYLRTFEKEHPSLYIVGGILLVIGEIWLFYKVVQVSWIAAEGHGWLVEPPKGTMSVLAGVGG